MTQELHPKLIEQLEKNRQKYQKVTAFAKLLPLFENEIIENWYTGESFTKFCYYYKGVPFNWGINWRLLRPTNYPENKAYENGTVEVYVNVLSLFNIEDAVYRAVSLDLYEHMKDVPCHFYDSLNSTYYFDPHEVENGLNALVDWYNGVVHKIKKFKEQEEVKSLEKRLSELKGKE